MKNKCRIVEVRKGGTTPHFKIQVEVRHWLFWRKWVDSPDVDPSATEKWICDVGDLPYPAKPFGTFKQAHDYMTKCAFPEKLAPVCTETVVAQYEI